MPDLYNYLMERLGGNPYSGYFSCLCPFHDDSKPSFFVYEESNSKNWEFRCASCGKHGSLQFLDRFMGSHFVPKSSSNTVSRVLPRWRRWEEKYGDLEGIADAAHRSLKAQPVLQTYFKRRKIDEYIKDGHLGILDNWACFPVYAKDSRIVDIVVRSIRSDADTRYVIHPSTSSNLRPLYCPDWRRLNESETVYIVFGIIDSISLHLAGLAAITGITGKSLSPESILSLQIRKRFVILPDEGEEKEAHKLANALGWRCKVKELDYPEDCKDPDNIRRKFGNEYLLQALGA